MNFLNLMDIKNEKLNQCLIEISLKPIAQNGYPEVQVEVGGKILHDGFVNKDILLYTQVTLLETFDVVMQLKNKKYCAQKETACIIEHIKIDNISLIPNLNHLSIYDNDHNQQVYSNYLGYNGKWQLSINKPFYQWLHYATKQGWLIEPLPL